MKFIKTFFLTLIMLTWFVAYAESGPNQPQQDIPVFESAQDRALVDQLVRGTRGKVGISKHAKTGKVRYIGGDPLDAIPQPSLLPPEATQEEAARGFLSVYGPLFGLKEQARELKVMRSKKADRGRSFTRFQQVNSGVPVFGGEIIIQSDSFNNIISAHSKIIPDISINTTPAISESTAEEKALEAVLKHYLDRYSLDKSSLEVSRPELWIYNPTVLGLNEDFDSLVWRMEVVPKKIVPIRELVLVDAHLGIVVLHFNQNPTALYREVYDHNNIVGKPLPGDPSDLKRSEGQAPSGITDVDNAYDYAGDTYNFYWNYHGRDSIDNAGMELISTTRISLDGSPYQNAMWLGDPYNQMIYGQGFASADDVVGHEMTHGVTQYESGLIYSNQSGAINEALSDIFGEFVDLTNGRGNDDPSVRWLIGEDLPGGAGRSMSNPPAYGDPDRMWSTYYYCGSCDNEGVHTNSGVGNKAAYLMTDGGTFNSITVTGLGITKVAKIFYEVQTNLLTSASDYGDLANALHQACMNLVGTEGITISDCQQVDHAIMATEMNQPPQTNLLSNPDFESGHLGWSEYSSGSYDIIWNDPSIAYCDGDWYAWLGGYLGDRDRDAVDYIYQDITIPSNATQAYLQFVVWIDTFETENVPYDVMAVEIRRPSNNALLSTLLTLSNLNRTSGWVRSSQYDLLPFKGQTIRLGFYATNDFWYPTSFLVDDVVLFAAIMTPPSAATLVSPSGTISDTTPTYTWNAVSNSTWYYLWVNDSTGTKIQQWYTAVQASCDPGTGTCSVTPTTAVLGSCQWWVQTYNSAGYGPWSADLIFTVSPPGPATLISPSGTITTTTPTYTWNAVAGSTWYYLWVADSKGTKIQEWYTASQAGCPDGTGTCSVTLTTEVIGLCKWWIQTWSSAGYGPWSTPLPFTTPIPPLPPAAALVTPSGAITTTTPTYTWNAVSNSTWYYLWVNDSTGAKIQKWYRASEAGCASGTGNCSVTPTTPLAPGAGKWWIQTYNTTGYGPWSTGLNFTASAPGPAALVSPSGTIGTTTPTYTWNAVSNSTWYYLWVDDSAGNKIQNWYRAADAGCASGTGTCSVTPATDLALGAGAWWIQTWNPVGYGPWSSGMSFTVSPY